MSGQVWASTLSMAVAMHVAAAVGADVPTLSPNTLLRMPPMPESPIVDGSITRAEERAASVWYGPISTTTGLMTTRYGVFHFGYTDEGFYFAVRTSVPQRPQSLTADDRIVLTLLPPGAAQPLSFSVCVADGSNDLPAGGAAAVRRLKGITDYGILCAETEMFVPYSATLPKPADGESWGLQMAVSFSCDGETGQWHWNPDAPDELGTFMPDSTSVIPSLVNFGRLESYRQSAWYRMKFRFRNPTARDLLLTSASMAHTGVGHAKLDDNPESDVTLTHKKVNDMHNKTVAAGEIGEFRYEDTPLWPGTVNILDLDISADGQAVMRRKLRWDLGTGLSWRESQGLPRLHAAFYPSDGNRIRMRYDVYKFQRLYRGTITLTGADGEVYWSQDLTGNPYLPACDYFNPRLPDLPPQDYTLHFSSFEKDSEREFVDDCTFAVREFAWQGLGLGKDEVILPPFKPIQAEGERTMFLQTGYRSAGILWDAVYAQGENILAAPVTLRLNGEEFSVTGTETLTNRPCRVVRRVTATCSGVDLVVTQDYDYDGFCQVRFDFTPQSSVTVQSLRLAVPLRNEIARLFEVQLRDDVRAEKSPDFTLREGLGEVWNSAEHVKSYIPDIFTAYVQPYVWFGDSARGFCTLLASVRDLSLVKSVPAQRIVRTGASATLEEDFVNSEVVWDSPKSITVAFEPTPVKPREWQNFAFAEHMYSYEHPTNAVGYSISSGRFFAVEPLVSDFNILPANDPSFLHWCLAQKTNTEHTLTYEKADEFIARNAEWFATNGWELSATEYRNSLDTSWRRTGNRESLCYYDPLLVSCFWPEWEMYKSDWGTTEWPDDYLYNEYSGRPSHSRIDKMLWDIRNSLRLGFTGIYFDCFTLQPDVNFASSDGRAYLKDREHIQYHLGNLLEWRELVKRTATLCYLEGAVANGRPMVEVHATDGIVAPVCAFASSALCIERGGGMVMTNGWPSAFCESYLRADVSGRQAGVSTRFICKTANTAQNLRSLMAFMCAYGMFNLCDQGTYGQAWFEKAWNAVFDFGWGRPGVAPHFEYQGDPMPVTHDGTNVRLTIARKADEALLMFGNVGTADETVALDVGGLGFGETLLTDVETGASVDAGSVHVSGHGYRLIRVARAEPAAISDDVFAGVGGDLAADAVASSMTRRVFFQCNETSTPYFLSEDYSLHSIGFAGTGGRWLFDFTEGNRQLSLTSGGLIVEDDKVDICFRGGVWDFGGYGLYPVGAQVGANEGAGNRIVLDNFCTMRNVEAFGGLVGSPNAVFRVTGHSVLAVNKDLHVFVNDDRGPAGPSTNMLFEISDGGRVSCRDVRFDAVAGSPSPTLDRGNVFRVTGPESSFSSPVGSFLMGYGTRGNVFEVTDGATAEIGYPRVGNSPNTSKTGFRISDGASLTVCSTTLTFGNDANDPSKGGLFLHALSGARVRMGRQGEQGFAMKSAGNELLVDAAEMLCADVRLGTRHGATGNVVRVENGGVLTVGSSFCVSGAGNVVVVSNGTLAVTVDSTASPDVPQFIFGYDSVSNGTLVLRGRSPKVVATKTGLAFRHGAVLRFELPPEGYAEPPLDLLQIMNYDMRYEFSGIAACRRRLTAPAEIPIARLHWRMWDGESAFAAIARVNETLPQGCYLYKTGKYREGQGERLFLHLEPAAGFSLMIR